MINGNVIELISTVKNYLGYCFFTLELLALWQVEVCVGAHDSLRDPNYNED